MRTLFCQASGICIAMMVTIGALHAADVTHPASDIYLADTERQRLSIQAPPPRVRYEFLRSPRYIEPPAAPSKKPEKRLMKQPKAVPQEPLNRHFQRYAKRYFGSGTDWQWFLAQAMVESELMPGAVSNAGAMGLMQIMPGTFQEIHQRNKKLKNPFDPHNSIAAGIYYNRQLYNQWGSIPNERDRRRFMFASYNAGLSAVKGVVKRRGAVRSFAEIKKYLPTESSQYVARIERQHQLLVATESPMSQGYQSP